MAAAQLPPLKFEEGGLQIVLLEGYDETGSFGDPFQDYFDRQDDQSRDKEAYRSIHPLQTPRHKPNEKVAMADRQQTSAKRDHPEPLHGHRQEPRRAHPPSRPTRQENPQPPRSEPQRQHQTEHKSHRPQEREQVRTHEVLHEPPGSPSTTDDAVPEHPIPAFQDAFAESLREATEGTADQKPNLRAMDAKSRREMLLSQDKDDDPFDVKWRYRPGQTQHEVMKLVAQISFGVYLMFNGMANSNSQVIGILQGHIDEIDEFLEIALEDLNQAVDDLTKRIQHLKLPMENITVFEQLLEDRKFRAEILDGNERIDGILTRTNAAMRQWDDDIEAGLRSSTVFASWLNDQSDGHWRQEQPDLVDVYDAMKGNTEGWLNAFEDMNDRAQEINGLVMTLMTIITEMESKAGEVSRRTWTAVPPFSTPAGTAVHQSPHKTIKGASPSPPPSRHSDAMSPNPSVSQAYAPNPLSLTPNESNRGDEDEDDDDDTFFPLPGGLPLLPPTTNRPRDTASLSSKPRSDTITESPVINLTDTSSDQTPKGAQSEDPSLYILQPRTYTPQPPAPVPSPRLRATPSPAEHAPLRKQASLRDRIANPPTSIHIPPTSTPDSPMFVPSPNFATPRTATSMHDLRSPDNGYNRPPPRPRVTSPMETPTSDMRTTFTPSPFSEHHVFQPVRASPHSPLQQRPHTATTPQRPGTGQTSAHKPTPLGAMTNMSSVTVAKSVEERENMSSASSQNHDRQLKKKKSAFGWFKKAFTMDEDERAAFEARKAAMAAQSGNYYDPNTPRFIDGRRIR